MLTIDIATPCSKGQDPDWWGNVMTASLLTQQAGIKIGHVIRATGALTDTARNQNMRMFLEGAADAVFQADDDTIPHSAAMYRLAEMNVPIASGVYFSRVDIKNHEAPVPLFYRRDEGYYVPIKDYYKGEIVECDGIGMGCTLIRREVFTAIMEHFVLMQRYTGPLIPVPPDKVAEFERIGLKRYEALTEIKPRDYPFYVFDNGRTEDFFFCELAAEVGYRPIVDTRLECGHIGKYIITGDDFWDSQIEEREREGVVGIRSVSRLHAGRAGAGSRVQGAGQLVERKEGAALHEARPDVSRPEGQAVQ